MLQDADRPKSKSAYPGQGQARAPDLRWPARYAGCVPQAPRFRQDSARRDEAQDIARFHQLKQRDVYTYKTPENKRQALEHELLKIKEKQKKSNAANSSKIRAFNAVHRLYTRTDR